MVYSLNLSPSKYRTYVLTKGHITRWNLIQLYIDSSEARIHLSIHPEIFDKHETRGITPFSVVAHRGAIQRYVQALAHSKAATYSWAFYRGLPYVPTLTHKGDMLYPFTRPWGGRVLCPILPIGELCLIYALANRGATHT